jgi:hypothetical protein
MIDKDSINFDNAVQRGYVWDKKRKSLLIDSIITGYPIPAFFAAKNENGYDMLDGKQRSITVHGFINNEFALSDVEDFETESGELVPLSDKHFNELPEDIQDTILSYSFTIYYFDGITDDEISEMFYRLNNGKPLSAFDQMRVKIKDHAKIKEISQHNIFNSALTEKALAANKAEDIAMKAWAILYMDNPSFDRKELEPVLTVASISDDEVKNIKIAFDRLLKSYTEMSNYTGLEAKDLKQIKKIQKRMFAKTHLVSLVPFALRSVNDNISTENFSKWIEHFYAGTKHASISDSYNDNATTGSSSANAVKARLDALDADYKVFMNTNKADIKDGSEEAKEILKVEEPKVVSSVVEMVETPKADTEIDETAYHAFCQSNTGKILNTRDNSNPVEFNDMNEEERHMLYTFCDVEPNKNKYEGVIMKAFNRVEKIKPDEKESA